MGASCMNWTVTVLLFFFFMKPPNKALLKFLVSINSIFCTTCSLQRLTWLVMSTPGCIKMIVWNTGKKAVWIILTVFQRCHFRFHFEAKFSVWKPLADFPFLYFPWNTDLALITVHSCYACPYTVLSSTAMLFFCPFLFPSLLFFSFPLYSTELTKSVK